jgi:hypothetical protein
LFTKRILKEWCSHISLPKDNQSTWVMVHSIIRKRSSVDCFSLRPYIYIVHSLLYIYAWLSVYFSCSNCMRRCALFIRCMLVHSLYMCISHANSFFFNQPTKYRRQSGARWSTTVRTIVVIIVLYHSSYPLEHPLLSLSHSSFVDGLIILDICVDYSV